MKRYLFLFIILNLLLVSSAQAELQSQYIHGDEVVVDTETGKIWTPYMWNNKNLNEARNHCGGLNLVTQGWNVPTEAELYDFLKKYQAQSIKPAGRYYDKFQWTRDNQIPPPVHGRIYFKIIQLNGNGTLKSSSVEGSDKGGDLAVRCVNHNYSPPVKAGIFDGAGSLINSPQDCYGCNKDIAVMHPHLGTGSTVVFQWLYNGSQCEFLDLTADKNIEVVVKSKTWSEHLTQKAFKTTLSSSPVSLKRAGDWTTFAISSTSSISNKTWITAQCRKPNNTFYNGSKQSVAKDLVDATYGYYWTGTGSIISQAKREGYGVGYDVAATFSSKKSLTSFQWLSTSSCSKLEISDGSSAHHNANVSIKVWNDKEFSQVCSSLPCSISKSTNFYVIKVKSDANEFNGGTIRASCK